MKDASGEGGGSGGPQGPESAWRDALLAAALVAVDPAGLGGVCLRARHGPVRERWLAGLRAMLPPEMPVRRIPPHVADDRLLGGLDLGATLAAGRPVAGRGLLAEADGGLLVLPMAERTEARLAGRLSAVLDTGRLRTEREGLSLDVPARVGLVALDEGESAEEGAPEPLTDRLAFRIDLSHVPQGATGPGLLGARDVAAARAALAGIAPDPGSEDTLTATALAVGILSLRPALQAVRAARALRALYGAAMSPAEAAEIAARLVIAPRAVTLPPMEAEEEEDAPPPEQPEEETPPDPPEDGQPQEGEALPDRVLEAVKAALPADLLATLMAGGAAPRQAPAAGRAGAERRAPDRGRPIGSRPGHPGGRARLDLVDTLRSAAPWQPLRRRETAGAEPGRVLVRAEDFRIKRFKRHSGTATIFVVDASGSAAVARLAEAKGAVEILLAESYVRRDLVGLVAFRGQGAEVLLPPTQSPALAKKRLAALPGGGGTPLAAGLEAALTLADQVRDRGPTPHVVVLTDGRANIARDGAQGRPKAAEDAHLAAQAIRARGHPSLVIDTSPRPRGEAARLAEALGGRFLALPRADAGVLSRAARASGPGS